MLGQIELGEANPSLVTVAKIAHALGTTFDGLLREPRAESLVVNAPGETPGVWSSSEGSAANLVVSSTLRPAAEVWEWRLVPGDEYQAEPDPPGSQELFYVIEGTLTLLVGGAPAGTLAPGASARLATDQPYGYRNDADTDVRFVRVAHVTA